MSTSPNSSDLAEPPPFPWVYAYQEDGPRLGGITLRPVVPVSLEGPLGAGSPVFALVDSGCSHTLAAPWLADDIGVRPSESDVELKIGIGGRSHLVKFTPVTMRLYPPGPAGDDAFAEWEDLVGFVEHWLPTWPVLVGQDAFMKAFTVTMSRHAQAVAIEAGDAFDRRFPPPPAPVADG